MLMDYSKVLAQEYGRGENAELNCIFPSLLIMYLAVLLCQSSVLYEKLAREMNSYAFSASIPRSLDFLNWQRMCNG